MKSSPQDDVFAGLPLPILAVFGVPELVPLVPVDARRGVKTELFGDWYTT